MSDGESRLLLWVFYADDGKFGELNHTYASTEDAARGQLQAWMAEQVVMGREKIEVKHWPGGFRPGYRKYWPGSIAAQEEASYVTTTTYH